MSSNHCNPCSAQTSSEADSAGEPAASSDQVSAIYDPRSHMRLWLIAAVGLVADLWSKHWAFTSLDPDPYSRGWIAIPGVVAFRRSLNPGALFGIGKGLTPVFIGASVIALGFVLFLFYHSDRRRRSLHVALGLVLAGAMGNLYDRTFHIADVVVFNENGRNTMIVGRILNPGESPILVAPWPDGTKPKYPPIKQEDALKIRQSGVVRDFIKFEPHIKSGKHTIDLWPWIFNVADVMLVFGVSILMLNFWWEHRQEKAAEARAAAEMSRSQEVHE